MWFRIKLGIVMSMSRPQRKYPFRNVISDGVTNSFKIWPLQSDFAREGKYITSHHWLMLLRMMYITILYRNTKYLDFSWKWPFIWSLYGENRKSKKDRKFGGRHWILVYLFWKMRFCNVADGTNGTDLVSMTHITPIIFDGVRKVSWVTLRTSMKKVKVM